MFLSRLLASLLVFVYLAKVFGAACLVADEVEALKQIAKTIGKRDWDFSVDPCSGASGWFTRDATKDLSNEVTCNDGCTTNSTSCHVVSIVLKRQNLSGILPPELVRLPYLQNIDLVRNYLNGSIIPKEWGSMQQLVNISLVGNGLTGSIPKELGNISTLKKISVEFNQLSGAIPPELGNLSIIEDLHFTSNYFTGELPGNLAKLTTLKDFRIGGNYFRGQIPNFIENWTSLKKLVIQGSGLDGPIPSGIARLGNMTDLRITDLNRSEGTFPPLMYMKNLQTLILRSCNITGQLPEYLGQLSNLNVLDLSFNKLSGEIPSYDGLSMLKSMYLTGNLLTGSVPGWILNTNLPSDLSYNNFTYGSSMNSSCQHGNVNLFGSFLEGSNSGIVPCLRGFQCPKNYSSLHINCGGTEVMVNRNTTYEDDTDRAGRANFVQRSGRNWAYSSTGHFLDGYIEDSYIMENDVYSELIRDARASPLSLTYYIFCLINGNYTVSLHFAEIIFTDDETFKSLGRRIFDVYIQGKLVLKDFNIKDAAGGVHKEIKKESTVIVTNQTLEIRFYWAGKGTTGLPDRGDYGPLISAISVTSDFEVPSEKGNSISAGIIVGIVAAVAFGILLVLGILWWKGCLWCKDAKDHGIFKPISHTPDNYDNNYYHPHHQHLFA